MIKMLTGYLPPTEGTARVANIDVLENSIDVRRRIATFRKPTRFMKNWPCMNR